MSQEVTSENAPPVEVSQTVTQAETAPPQSQPEQSAAGDPGAEAAATAEGSADQAASTEAARQRIKIGTQRYGTAVPKIPPRVTTDFKTSPAPQKQVFVRMDAQGNFTPLETPTAPPAAPQPQQHPPRQSHGGQDNRPPRAPQQQQQRPPQPPQQPQQPQQHEAPRQPHEEAHDEPAQREGQSLADNPAFRPKPAPLAPNPNKPATPLFVEKSGPRIERPNPRHALTADLEAELAEALGEGDALNEMIDQSSVPSVGVTLGQDTKYPARVLHVTREFVFVELPGKNQGAMQSLVFGETALPEPGTQLEVIVARFVADEGIYEVALSTSAIDVTDWSEVNEGIVVDAKVTGHNKGGLECQVNRLRGFIPAGQVSLYRIEDFSQFVGQTLMCVVMEANRDRRNLVLSRRAILEREQSAAREKLLTELEVGQEREAIIRSLRDFGAFADLGGVDGLIHISQMSWDRIKHPSEVLSEGQRVKVKIQKMDPATGKISLSLRDLYQNPWDSAPGKYPVSSTVNGTVSRIMEFGAFVKIEPGVEGLVHISEISHKRIFRVADVLQEGQPIEAKVLTLDPENQRMSLSIKALMARPEVAQKPGEAAAAEPEAPEPPRPAAQRKTPLKGGLGTGGGAQFGLKW